MQRPMPNTPPHTGAHVENRPSGGVVEEVSPAMAARAVCETVRDEHGRKGVGAFLAAAAPFLPYELLAETARHFSVDPPPNMTAPAAKPPQKDAPAIPPELLLSLLSNGGSGLDPMTLLKMLQK